MNGGSEHKFSMTLERFEELITTEDGLLENKLVSIENVMINPTNISSVVEKIGVPLSLWKLKTVHKKHPRGCFFMYKYVNYTMNL